MKSANRVEEEKIRKTKKSEKCKWSGIGKNRETIGSPSVHPVRFHVDLFCKCVPLRCSHVDFLRKCIPMLAAILIYPTTSCLTHLLSYSSPVLHPASYIHLSYTPAVLPFTCLTHLLSYLSGLAVFCPCLSYPSPALHFACLTCLLSYTPPVLHTSCLLCWLSHSPVRLSLLAVSDC